MNGFRRELRIHKFLTPKKGANPTECEDAVAIDSVRMTFAIADGATEAYDSKRWARLLVRAWVTIKPPAFELGDFDPLVRDLGVRLQRKWSRQKLPWYAEEKSQDGSFAAFIGLQFYEEGTDLRWKAIALGDCCLMHRRGAMLCDSFPIAKSEEFGSNPILLPSKASKQRQALDLIRRAEGTALSGDDFVLLSDAVGYWFLRQREDGNCDEMSLFDKLTESDDIQGLETFFEELRSTGKIRNDDVAILRIMIV
jgi:hypothetical protein